ncbi:MULTISPECIES: hypothetical protein [unclassified Isoptericola]|uniref:hypothetical protein n=1 Tax=unclassified Isoptericola TaxID=2623355 RepID=UPI00365E6000
MRHRSPPEPLTLDVPKPLLHLLYLRALWRLGVAPDVPAAVGQPAALPGTPRPREALAPEWDVRWTEALASLGGGPRPDPWWVTRPDDVPDPHVVSAWASGHAERIARAEVEAVGHREAPPEALAGDAATALRRVFVLPIATGYLRRLAPGTVLVAEQTRADPRAYAAALAEPPAGPDDPPRRHHDAGA